MEDAQFAMNTTGLVCVHFCHAIHCALRQGFYHLSLDTLRGKDAFIY